VDVLLMMNPSARVPFSDTLRIFVETGFYVYGSDKIPPQYYYTIKSTLVLR